MGLEDQCTLLSNEDFVPTYRPAGLVGDNNVNTEAAASYTPHGHTHSYSDPNTLIFFEGMDSIIIHVRNAPEPLMDAYHYGMETQTFHSHI